MTTIDTLLRLDLGCGPEPRDGYTGVDLYCGPERVDLTSFPWPWGTGSVAEVWCSHFVEHLDPGLWVPFVDELDRILAPDGFATITHPNLMSRRAFMDPTHRDFIPAERWLYADAEWRKANNLDHPPYPRCDFVAAVAHSGIHPDFEMRDDLAKQFAGSHYWDVVGDLQVTLRRRGDPAFDGLRASAEG